MDNDTSMNDFLAEFLTDNWISEHELCQYMGIGGDVLKVCLEWEVIDPPNMNREGHPIYHSRTVDRLGRALRLHRDLGVNWVGISIILDLLERLELIEQQLGERRDREI